MSQVSASTAQVRLAEHEPATSFGCAVMKRSRPACRRAIIALDAAEQLLVLELLVGEAHQRFQRDLVAERVVAAELEHLAPMKRSTSPNMLA